MKSMNIPELGVGIIYFSGFEKILESNSDLIQVIEIEPQTFWYKSKSGLDSFKIDEQKIDYLNSFSTPKIFHGVGFPVGGSIRPNEKHIPVLQQMMDALQPVWLSEHLSFNEILLGKDLVNTNFLLPPLQTREGIEVASKAIRDYAARFDLPFAFETGVNYLSGYDFEMEDGTFINKVAQKSDTSILLDLHNLLANQKNGRQNIYDFLNQIDLDRVLQIHLAGGFYFDGYYLDAHSNVSSQEVLDIFEHTVQLLPNLKAITFEMLPEYLNFVSPKAIREQLQKMNSIWDKRGKKANGKKPKKTPPVIETHKTPSVKEWESTLGLLAIGRSVNPETELSKLLEKDQGVGVIKKLVEKFKASLVVSALNLTCRYLMLKKGSDGFNEILKDFWSKSNPQLFATDNGFAFIEYLYQHSNLLEQDALLKDLLLYEHNSLLTLVDKQEREINISFNPNELVPYLAEGQLPVNLNIDNYLVAIEPDLEYQNESMQSVFHT